MEKRNIIGVSCIIIVLLLLFSIGVYRKRRLKSNFAITNGRIYELGNSYKSGNRIFFKFTFEIGNKYFRGNTSIPCDRDKKSLYATMMINRQMPVAYQKDNPDNCEMLFLKSSFEKYKIEIPVDIRTTVDSIENICSESE